MSVRRGQHWEAVAGEYLERQGLTILARGYRCRLGEIDLLCRDDTTLIVVEVRARSSGAYTEAAFSIGPQKRMRIIRATRHLLMRNAHWHAIPIRFDVIAFDAIDTEQPRIDWIKSAFQIEAQWRDHRLELRNGRTRAQTLSRKPRGQASVDRLGARHCGRCTTHDTLPAR